MNMHKVYDEWPEIAEEAYCHSDEKPVNFPDVTHIIFAGMGGSGAIGDVFSSILSKTKVHVTVVKGYVLPRTADSNTLVITTSVSGNTPETLSVLTAATKMNCRITAFSSGGRMEQFCKEHTVEFRKIKQTHSPRASFARFLFSMLSALEPVLPLDAEDIKEAINHLKIMRECISSLNIGSVKDNPALQLAEQVKGIPLIYYPSGLQAAAIRFKNNLQENSKKHAIVEDVVEACHNGVVAWEKDSEVVPILITGADDHEKTKERWIVLKEYFDVYGISYYEIATIQGGILAKLVNMIYLVDYATIYHAVNSGIDPSPIMSIDFIKSRI